jgi:hypothetical protein
VQPTISKNPLTNDVAGYPHPMFTIGLPPQAEQAHNSGGKVHPEFRIDDDLLAWPEDCFLGHKDVNCGRLASPVL